MDPAASVGGAAAATDSGWSRWLQPQQRVEPRASDPITARYVRSYLLMRVFVGVLGIALPLLLVGIDRLAFDGVPSPRDSLSAYYYSGVRELFVGGLVAIGVFLVTYKVAEKSLDNTLSVIAGAAAIGVGLLPTKRPEGSGAVLTPLQDLLGERVVQGLHFVSAALFIAALAGMSVLFGLREGRREQSGKRPPQFWRTYHFACAGAIGAALLWIVVAALILDWPRMALLIGEWISVWAFAASWLMKGWERDALRGHS